MHIGIDARMYGPLTRGIGRYIQETIKHLEKIDSKNHYTIFIHSENYNDYTPQNTRFKKVCAPWRWYGIKEQIFFTKFIERHKVELMHFPHSNVPLQYKKNFIVTIHDLILLRDTQQRTTTLGPIIYNFKKFFYKKVLRHTVTAAKEIIVPTEFGKKDLLKTFSIPEKKISVIYEGVTNDTSLDTNMKIRYNISKPFLMYVGSAYPHKNLENLILTLDTLTKKHDINLIIVGRKDFFSTRLENEYPRSYIQYLGYIPDEELKHLYKEAIAYIFPSRYEGFGLPPLEAMVHECPVISSNASCLPEVLGSAALYFDPLKTESMEKAIVDIITKPKLRNEFCKKGSERVKKYSWEESAKKTLELYMKFHQSDTV